MSNADDIVYSRNQSLLALKGPVTIHFLDGNVVEGDFATQDAFNIFLTVGGEPMMIPRSQIRFITGRQGQQIEADTSQDDFLVARPIPEETADTYEDAHPEIEPTPIEKVSTVGAEAQEFAVPDQLDEDEDEGTIFLQSDQDKDEGTIIFQSDQDEDEGTIIFQSDQDEDEGTIFLQSDQDEDEGTIFLQSDQDADEGTIFLQSDQDKDEGTIFLQSDQDKDEGTIIFQSDQDADEGTIFLQSDQDEDEGTIILKADEADEYDGTLALYPDTDQVPAGHDDDMPAGYDDDDEGTLILDSGEESFSEIEGTEERDLDMTVLLDDLAEEPVEPDSLEENATVVLDEQKLPQITASLICTSGPHSGEVWPLTGGMITLGRSSDNTLVLAKDKEISRHHAIILQESGQFVIQDQNSLNGTFVNDKKIMTPHYLTDGDSVLVGLSTFRYQVT